MRPYSIAIIGVGPKGLYAFERLLARLHQENNDSNIEVHLFEKTGVFGAGEIYHPNQPEYLLMNYPNRNINVWLKEHPESIVPERLDFVAWLDKNGGPSIGDSENGFSPRRTVGEYLIYCFNLLEKHAKKSIQIIKHKTEVTDVKPHGDELLLKYVSQYSRLSTTLKVNEVLLTTGHSSCKGKLERDKDSCASDIDHQAFIPFVYPVEEKLAPIKANTRVAVKGLGLTFIDTVLALTEGRGGRFEKLKNGRLIYMPSGREPSKIFPFSRSGMPMIPRNANEGLLPYKPIYFTPENIKAQAGSNQKISFAKHMLPLLISEMQYRYYRIVFESHDLSFYPDKNLRSLDKQIRVFHEQYPQVYRFNFTDLFKAKPFDESVSELGALAYWHYLLKEAALGSESSAFMAAATTWGRLSETFNAIYSFGGMTADSQALFDSQYRSILNRISYGPPLLNMKKMVALVETGLIDLDFSEKPEVQTLNEGWGICTNQFNFQKVDVLIDARIPTLDSTKDWSLLFSNMRKNGLLRPFTISDDTTYEAGCPEIDRQGRAVDQNGYPILNISLYGTPTERITYDNDTLSRTRNNFASQWALNVLKNYKATTIKSKKSKIYNG